MQILNCRGMVCTRADTWVCPYAGEDMPCDRLRANGRKAIFKAIKWRRMRSFREGCFYRLDNAGAAG